ncbi:MAG TPA: FeoB-associated Cys-rich membrane protein [Caulifigura sp.]|jgi:hypothetical protein|nr:FeoB-associated Cys-rich membrane protein [Caulifigura sp.]
MPTIDWQTVIAIACVALAAAWWVRRAVRWASGDQSCGTGCGKCGTSTPLQSPLVQIDSGMNAPGQDSHQGH